MKKKASRLVGVCVTLGLAASSCMAGGGNMIAFVRKHCADCHNSHTKKSGLDLTTLAYEPANPENFARWEVIHDRVTGGEMPPEGADHPPVNELKAFTGELFTSLVKVDKARVAREGRTTRRRMNRHEYENTLRDLLSLPWLDVKDFLPEDSKAHGFNKVGDALDVSYVQLSRYLKAAEFALRAAIVPQSARPESQIQLIRTWDERGFSKNAGPDIRRTHKLAGYDVVQRRRRRRGKQVQPQPKTPQAKPVDLKWQSVALLTSTFEPTEIRFSSFRAPIDGRYKLRFSCYTIWMAPNFRQAYEGRRPEPVVIFSDQTPGIYRMLGSFDVGPGPTVRELDIYLHAGESIRPDAVRLPRSRPPDFQNPLAEEDGMPGVAFQWMESEGPIIDKWPPPGHKLLFGDLEIRNRPAPVSEGDDRRSRSRSRSRGRRRGPSGVEIISTNPKEDARRLLTKFMQVAYRPPVNPADVERFLKVIDSALDADYSFTDAMIAGYTGVLSSPAFIYFYEKPGPLSGRALADRLAYFLWNTRPDEKLYRLAENGELLHAGVLRRQTERMLDDPRSRQFINAFLDYWLDLKEATANFPDVLLYPEYDLYDLLVQSAVEETQLYFREMIRQDLGAAYLIDSDFTMLNETLATHYGIDGVEGVKLRRVKLPEGSVRGGFLTQSSVLKVTANGTSTSPVLRGAWVMERLLGKPVPPPPANVPTVEPDVRGAITIRQQLAKHRSIESCNVCHQHIDPPGFALESFDVMGAERDFYRSLGEGQRVHGIGHNGLRFSYRRGPNVDSSGVLADGREFQDIRDLKALLLQDESQLCRNLMKQLTVYATGAPIRFSDRPIIEAQSKLEGVGVRTLIHTIIQSKMFRNK